MEGSVNVAHGIRDAKNADFYLGLMIPSSNAMNKNRI